MWTPSTIWALSIFGKNSITTHLNIFQRPPKADPQRDYIHNNLGMLYTEMGMHAEAKGEFEKAIDLADKSR